MGNACVSTKQIFITYTLKCSIECRIHRTHQERQVNIACNVPYLCQFSPIQACWLHQSITLSIRLEQAYSQTKHMGSVMTPKWYQQHRFSTINIDQEQIYCQTQMLMDKMVYNKILTVFCLSENLTKSLQQKGWNRA